MKKPFIGEPLSYKQYFAGNPETHFVGILGGLIWGGIGTASSYIAAGTAGAAISYALGGKLLQWWPHSGGVINLERIQRCPRKKVNQLLTLMFLFFVTGLIFIIYSGGN